MSVFLFEVCFSLSSWILTTGEFLRDCNESWPNSVRAKDYAQRIAMSIAFLQPANAKSSEANDQPDELS